MPDCTAQNELFGRVGRHRIECAQTGEIPTPAVYLARVEALDEKASEVYRYMNFDKIEDFKDVADTVEV